jgi:hypothetical protein
MSTDVTEPPQGYPAFLAELKQRGPLPEQYQILAVEPNRDSTG